MPSSSSVSMEQAISRLERMRREIVAELDDTLGRQSWGDAPNEDGITRAGCNDDAEAETVNLRTQYVEGAYPETDWGTQAEIVERIARRYDFDTVKVVVDRPGNHEIVGTAKDGASFTYGASTTTIFGLRTGCHRWDTTPSPEG